MSVKVKSSESLLFSRTAETSFPSRDQSPGLGPRKTAAFSDQSHRPDRDPRRKADRDVDHLAVQVIRPAGVEAPGVVPVEGDAITALHDRILEQLGGQARVVVVQTVEQFRPYGAHIHPLQDRELCRCPTSGTEHEEPDVEELVVCVDAEFAVCPEALGRARVATAENERQAGGHDNPIIEHRSTPVSVRSPQQEAARRNKRDARRISTREVSHGVQRDVLASATWSGSTVMARSGAAPPIYESLTARFCPADHGPSRPSRPSRPSQSPIAATVTMPWKT